MLDAEGEVYAMHVTPNVVEAYVNENNGAWPDSWEALKSGPQPVVFLQHDSIDYEIVLRKITIDFDADPAQLAQQIPANFTAIRPINPVYDYSDDYGIAQLIQTLKKYHPEGP